jgi:hypothetical protein
MCLVIAGDGVGGNMVGAVGLFAKQRGGAPIRFQFLFRRMRPSEPCALPAAASRRGSPLERYIEQASRRPQPEVGGPSLARRCQRVASGIDRRCHLVATKIGGNLTADGGTWIVQVLNDEPSFATAMSEEPMVRAASLCAVVCWKYRNSVGSALVPE